MKSQFPEALLKRLHSSGVMTVLVVDELSSAVPLARALLDGGISAMELALRTPVAFEALKVIKENVPDMLAGVGTILTPKQVREAVAAAAEFGVSPGTNPDVIQEARKLGLPFAPGIVTPTDLETAVTLGCRELKFFPAETSGGLPYLRSMGAPYCHLGIQFIPLGGLNQENIATYLAEPSVLVVGGSWIAPRKLIREGAWDTITSYAAKASQCVQEVRGKDA